VELRGWRILLVVLLFVEQLELVIISARQIKQWKLVIFLLLKLMDDSKKLRLLPISDDDIVVA